MLRRKTIPAAPINLPIPPFLETDAERESRVRDQKRLDDSYKSLMESHRTYADKLETDYATAIGIVLQHVSTAIRTDLTLVIEGEALANQSSEDKYLAMRTHLELKHGPNSKKDAETIKRTIQAMDGDTMGWSQYAKDFDERTQTLKKTILRSPAGEPLRGPVPTMPPPALLPPNATAAMVQAWYLDYHNQSTAFHAANPIGPILTHEPSDETKRGWLMHALERSRHTRVRNIYLKYIQPDHQARPYREVP